MNRVRALLTSFQFVANCWCRLLAVFWPQQSPEMQLHELREYRQRRQLEVANEYVDVGISEAKEKRAELDRLMADAYRRRFDAVVVWKFDRFARSVSHLVRPLETFRALGPILSRPGLAQCKSARTGSLFGISHRGIAAGFKTQVV